MPSRALRWKPEGRCDYTVQNLAPKPWVCCPGNMYSGLNRPRRRAPAPLSSSEERFAKDSLRLARPFSVLFERAGRPFSQEVGARPAHRGSGPPRDQLSSPCRQADGQGRHLGECARSGLAGETTAVAAPRSSRQACRARETAGKGAHPSYSWRSGSRNESCQRKHQKRRWRRPRGRHAR